MPTDVGGLVNLVADKIINPIIALLVAVGLLVFIYGVVEYLWGLSTELGDGKERGKKHMLYGIVGMFVMIAAFAILSLVAKMVCSGGSLNGCIR